MSAAARMQGAVEYDFLRLLAAALLEFPAAAARTGLIAAGLGGCADYRFRHGLPGGKVPDAVLLLERG
jgi:hypothetical protein